MENETGMFDIKLMRVRTDVRREKDAHYVINGMK